MPGVPGATVVTTLVCYQHTAHEAAGATGTRHSPRPLWAKVSYKTRAHRAAGSRSHIVTSLRGAQATKQSILSLRGELDCFACARNDEGAAPSFQSGRSLG